MQSTQGDSSRKNLTMSPSIVELLNEAAVVPVGRDGSVTIISSSDLQFDLSMHPLGSGTFATCVPAVKGGTLKCAVKIQKYLNYDQFDRELTAMLKCNRHKNAGIVELWWVCMPPPGTMSVPRLVMPVVDGVLLGEWLSGHSGCEKRASLRVAVQLVQAVCHLHDTVRIVHGDLGWKNAKIDIARNHHLTLFDFGNARDAAKGERRLWVHGNYFLSPPEALCGRSCDLVAAELHVVGVLLICIARGTTQGLGRCPPPFEECKDRDDKRAIARLVRFWGRARLYPYWTDFRKIAGDEIDQVDGNPSEAITGKIGLTGLRLVHPIPNSRQSLAESLRVLSRT